MPSLGRNPALMGYGPGQADWEYDKQRQKEVDMDAQPQDVNLFEMQARVQALAIKIGRQQMALEILRFLEKGGVDGPRIAHVMDLCARESK